MIVCRLPPGQHAEELQGEQTAELGFPGARRDRDPDEPKRIER